MSASVIVIINKFPGKCRVCGKSVPALLGVAIKEGSCNWQTAHCECEPVLSDPILKAREEKRAAYLAKEKAREEAKAAGAARRAVLFEKTGLDLSSEVQVSSSQGAYNDSFLSYYTFSGEGSLGDFQELLNTPAESSYGQLRWSNGRRVTKIEGNRVFVSESISACD